MVNRFQRWLIDNRPMKPDRWDHKKRFRLWLAKYGGVNRGYHSRWWGRRGRSELLRKHFSPIRFS